MVLKKLASTFLMAFLVLSLVSCATKRAETPPQPGAPGTPLTVVRFEVAKGVGISEESVKNFESSLLGALDRAGFAATVVDGESEIPKAGLALKGKIAELPSSTLSRGKVSVFCTFFLDGEEVKSQRYAQDVTSTENNLTPDQRDISRNPQREAVNMALHDLVVDLRNCSRKAGK